LSDEDIERLDALGKTLIAASKSAAEPIISDIDSVLLASLGFDALSQEEKKNQLKQILKQYIETRT
jgi:hypothetical protein